MSIIAYDHKVNVSDPTTVDEYLGLIRGIDLEPDFVVKGGEVLAGDAMLQPGDIVDLGETIQIV